tara:strand:+ start:2219 stop:2452 length:234 start_codon:yes stop_codon:yes gene_type:complete
MTTINFPSGESINFGELPPEEIEPIIAQLQEEKPELFQFSEENLSVDQIFERAGAGSTDAEDSNVPDVPDVPITVVY